MRKILLTLILATLGFGVQAATNEDSDSTMILRPVYAAYTLQIGSAHHADTYLSPIKYSGWGVGLGYQRRQAMKFNPKSWISQIRFELDIDYTQNISRNATMWYAGIDFNYSLLHRWQLASGFSLGIGPSVAINAGCLYLDRNGNNPASARAAVTINADGYVAWNGRMLNRPITLRYQATVPAFGAFFSPDYGELYYEIYLGNHSELCHFAWPGNYTRLSHWLTADINLGSTSLQLGYRGDIFSSKANNLVSRTITHSAIIGISGEWFSVNPNKGISTTAQMISATY